MTQDSPPTLPNRFQLLGGGAARACSLTILGGSGFDHGLDLLVSEKAGVHIWVRKSPPLFRSPIAAFRREARIEDIGAI